MSDTCALLEAWLYRSPAAGLPPDDLVAHLGACPRCRTALIALLADRLGPLPHPHDCDCAALEADLPAFVDYELARGPAAAARAFPDVWWHTLVCPDCDELYRALQALALPPVRRPRWPAEVQLTLHPALVRQSLGVGRHLGAQWGEAEEDTVIAEQPAEIGVLQVALRQELPGRVALVVRTQPPAAGVALLALGGLSYDAPLGPDGCAIFAGLAEALFSGDAEPIRVTIRPLHPE